VSGETTTERAERILGALRSAYPGKRCYDIDGRALHFVCEVEPVLDHPGYDKAVEVIISSSPHKHTRTTQRYTVLSGILELHLDDASVRLCQAIPTRFSQTSSTGGRAMMRR
jgi:hypothetical protein